MTIELGIEPLRLRLYPPRRVIEVRSARLPDGGIVATYTDVTQTVLAEEELAAANERLERRVQARTAELQVQRFTVAGSNIGDPAQPVPAVGSQTSPQARASHPPSSGPRAQHAYGCPLGASALGP